MDHPDEIRWDYEKSPAPGPGAGTKDNRPPLAIMTALDVRNRAQWDPVSIIT